MSAIDSIKIVNKKIAVACQKSGRAVEDIKLVAVSKTFPSDIIKTLFESGHNIFGESYVQEFLKKQEEIPQINWHFIGQLQSNKVKYIVNKISLLHSLDRQSLASEINKRYQAMDKKMDVLIQVNIGEESQKGGVNPKNLNNFLDSVMEMKGIQIKGLMCIHPYEDPEECRKYFVKMRNLFDKAKESGYPMIELSMGMSGDYVQAVEEGATLVRVGSAIFGNRY